MRRFCHSGASAILIGMLMCASAFAQQKNQGPPNALQGFSQNRDEPVKIQAASLEVREKEKIATFTGDVQVFQGDTEMRCKSLVVLYDDDPAAHGVKAAELVEHGEFGRMAALHGTEMTSVPLSEVEGVKHVDLDYLRIAATFFG